MIDALRDPAVRAVAVLSTLAIVGLAGVVLAWRGVAASLDVWVQLPFIASGALGGIALAGTALGILAIQSGRRAAAEERLVFDELIAAFSDGDVANGSSELAQERTRP